MQTHTHAPSGAPAGQTAVARLLEADWSKGIPPGYLAVLERLKQLRGEYEEQIAAAIDGLDILDMAIADLEPEEDANDEDLGSEPSLGAPEAVTCSDGPAEPVVRKARRNRSRKPLDGNGKPVAEGGKPARGLTLSLDRSCDQEHWAQGTSDAYTGHDAELDTADDEPSYGSIGSSGFISQSQWAEGGDQDEREDENEHGSDDDKGEAELGATTAMNHDHAWAAPGGVWAYQDGEPSLGWTGIGHGHPETAMRGYDGDREAVNEDGSDINDEPQDDNEIDGHGYDDMEPGGDIEGGVYRGRYRPSLNVIGDSDVGAGRLVVGRVVEDGGIAALGTVEVANV